MIVGNDPVQGAFRWTEQIGRVYLGTLPGAVGNAFVTDVSADGSTIVGWIHYDPNEAGDVAFRWTQQQGFELLFGSPSVLGNSAWGVSADGSVIVGRDTYNGAFIWAATHGARNLDQLLEDEYGLDLGGFHLTDAHDVSWDGRVVVGGGFYDGGASGFEAWRLVPEQANLSS
ncbi:MAG: hypothetical protein A2V70_07345 [Planctomycetes bacterium RBG_13_63_9]|nr:MAG: hypothetical protein A2V70_07345 [Planctomycetes bacterium RBG_13_63_9]